MVSLPNFSRPRVLERRAGIGLLVGSLFRRGAMRLQAVFVRDDLADAVGLVAAGVIAVMVRVEQHRDALGGALLQAGDADFCGIHELAVDGEGAVAVHEIANRAATADEHADTAAELLESRHRWRGRLCRGLTAEGGRAVARGVDCFADAEREGGEYKLSAIHGVLRNPEFYPRLAPGRDTGRRGHQRPRRHRRRPRRLVVSLAQRVARARGCGDSSRHPAATWRGRAGRVVIPDGTADRDCAERGHLVPISPDDDRRGGFVPATSARASCCAAEGSSIRNQSPP